MYVALVLLQTVILPLLSGGVQVAAKGGDWLHVFAVVVSSVAAGNLTAW